MYANIMEPKYSENQNTKMNPSEDELPANLMLLVRGVGFEPQDTLRFLAIFPLWFLALIFAFFIISSPFHVFLTLPLEC